VTCRASLPADSQATRLQDRPKLKRRRYCGVMTKFGVQLPNFSGFDPADLFEHVAGLATTAEDAGFDSVWVMDHFFQLPPLGGPDQPRPAPTR
jgi:hypothetical protein